ncbi:hypothetical protein [Mucilaginibacter ginsenosidivorax]|uniref:Phage tail protein n=1 Tax=Mucilaginibacter ginsenosidivorax TaxID=862126 RepID=A0A5B8W543_9SPHI|nr:hypothetical protein [Mucilaginibacter ginsenosidivorax]QEC78771.1 hypothetical protein FSB76_23505 [Mucilaginibacter ginsenosidivorax]
MANLCASVQAYTKQCGRGISGGVGKMWIVSYNDLGVISGSTEAYAFASGSTVISNIALASGKTFSSVGLLKESVTFKGSAKRDSATGSFENQTETTISISNISETAKAYVDSLMQAPVAILMKLRSGVYVVTGLNGLTELTDTEESSGTKNGDMNGYILKFTGVQDSLTSTVDPTLIASIVDKV